MPEFRIEPIIQTVTNGIKDGEKSAKKEEYHVIDKVTDKVLGSFSINPKSIRVVNYLDIDRGKLYDTLINKVLNAGGKRVKLPYPNEYEEVYSIYAEEGKNLTIDEKNCFAAKVLDFLKELSDKNKRPIVLNKGGVPDSVNLAAIESEEYVAVPRMRNPIMGEKGGRLIDGKEMSKIVQVIRSLKYGWENRFNQKTFDRVNKYLDNNNIDSLVYAEYAVHPKLKRPNLMTILQMTGVRVNRVLNRANNNFNKVKAALNREK